jgi:hypothetical protein
MLEKKVEVRLWRRLNPMTEVAVSVCSFDVDVVWVGSYGGAHNRAQHEFQAWRTIIRKSHADFS